MTVRKSQMYLPNPTTGQHEIHHLETELGQIEDMTAFMRALNTKAGADAARRYLGVGYRRRARKAFTLANLFSAIASGNYYEYDIEPGDYYEATASGYTYIFAGDNPMRGTFTGYPVTSDHAGLIVQTHATSKWNESGNTNGGYVASDLHAYLVDTVLPKVKTDIGTSHLYSHQKFYSNAVDAARYNRYGLATGASSSWAWSDAQFISALSEVQVYGSTVWSSSGYDTGEADQQLDVFKRFKHTAIFGNERPWLRDVVSSSYAAIAAHYGLASLNSVTTAAHVAGLICVH